MPCECLRPWLTPQFEWLSCLSVLKGGRHMPIYARPCDASSSNTNHQRLRPLGVRRENIQLAESSVRYRVLQGHEIPSLQEIYRWSIFIYRYMCPAGQYNAVSAKQASLDMCWRRPYAGSTEVPLGAAVESAGHRQECRSLVPAVARHRDNCNHVSPGTGREKGTFTVALRLTRRRRRRFGVLVSESLYFAHSRLDVPAGN